MKWIFLLIPIIIGLFFGALEGRLIWPAFASGGGINYPYFIIFTLLPAVKVLIICFFIKKFLSSWNTVRNQIIFIIISFITFIYGFTPMFNPYPWQLALKSTEYNIFSLILQTPLGFMVGLLFSILIILSVDGIVFLFFGLMSSIGVSYFLTKDIDNSDDRNKLILCYIIIVLIELFGMLGSVAGYY